MREIRIDVTLEWINFLLFFYIYILFILFTLKNRKKLVYSYALATSRFNRQISQNNGFSTSEKVRSTQLPHWHEVDMYNCTSVNLPLPGE